MHEYWDILDKNRRPTGRTQRRGRKLGSGEYHLICEAWLVCDGKLLVTQRHPEKRFGLMWECTGGAVKAGESSVDAIKREIYEEIGLTVDNSELIYKGSETGASFFVDCYEVNKSFTLRDLTLQKEEVVDARLVTYGEFMQMYKRRLLIPHMYNYMVNMDFGFLKLKEHI